MEIIIKGEAKEIAALVLAVQGRQLDSDMVQNIAKEMDLIIKRKPTWIKDIYLEQNDIVLHESELNQASEVSQDKFLYSMTSDPETGCVSIHPMNEKGCITIHGVDEAQEFINHLMDCFR